MARKRVTDQSSRIARLEEELLAARRLQLAYDQKKFLELEQQMDATQARYDRAAAKMEKETQAIERYETLRMEAIGRKSAAIQELEEIQGIMEEEQFQHANMMAEADELPAEVLEAQ